MRSIQILFTLLLVNSCQQKQKLDISTESKNKEVSVSAQNIASATSKLPHDAQAEEINKKSDENTNSEDHDEEFDLLNCNRVWNIFTASKDGYNEKFGTDIHSYHGCMIFGDGAAGIRFLHNPSDVLGLLVEKIGKNRYKLIDGNHSRIVLIKKLQKSEYCSNGPGLHIVTHRPKENKSDNDWEMLDEGFEFHGRTVQIACTLPEWKSIEMCLRSIIKHKENLKSDLNPP